MTVPWRQYQEDAAIVFRNLGLSAEVDKKVEGVRGTHDLDVYVSGKIYGLQVRWIVECKAWQSNIPKEKALALLAIVQDIGADKGILLSEIGFQSGAIKTARATNLILTSLADLEEQVESDFKESVLSKLSWRLELVKERLRELDADAAEYEWTANLSQGMRLFALDLAFRAASKNSFPTVYAIAEGETRLSAQNFDDLVLKAEGLLRAAEDHCDTEERKKRKVESDAKNPDE
jgi:hypothetical protein